MRYPGEAGITSAWSSSPTWASGPLWTSWAFRRRLAGDTGRQATSGEVKGLRQEMRDLKELVAELSLENRLLKKNMIGHGGGEE